MAAGAPRTPNRPAGLNRGLLTLIGIPLLLGGGYVAARGLGLLTRVGVDTDALPRLRQALELDELPTEILVRLGAKRAAIIFNE
jgi:hypothetical protein